MRNKISLNAIWLNIVLRKPVKLSVLRTFVHSISCHFSCQKLSNSNFFVKSQHSLLDFCHVTNFFQHYWFSFNFKPNFLIETGQILERSSNSLKKGLNSIKILRKKIWKNKKKFVAISRKNSGATFVVLKITKGYNRKWKWTKIENW